MVKLSFYYEVVKIKSLASLKFSVCQTNPRGQLAICIFIFSQLPSHLHWNVFVIARLVCWKMVKRKNMDLLKVTEGQFGNHWI